jgi:hypothetical protein
VYGDLYSRYLVNKGVTENQRQGIGLFTASAANALNVKTFSPFQHAVRKKDGEYFIAQLVEGVLIPEEFAHMDGESFDQLRWFGSVFQQQIGIFHCRRAPCRTDSSGNPTSDARVFIAKQLEACQCFQDATDLFICLIRNFSIIISEGIAPAFCS